MSLGKLTWAFVAISLVGVSVTVEACGGKTAGGSTSASNGNSMSSTSQPPGIGFTVATTRSVVTSASAPSCSALAECCATLPPSLAQQCSGPLEAGEGSDCALFFSQLQAVGDCLPVGSSGTGSSVTSSMSGFSTFTTSSSSNGPCYSPPGPVIPETMSGHLFCPFSGGDASTDIYCASGEQCCVPSEFPAVATCIPAMDTCPVKDSTDWVCEGTLDCSTNAGTVCCGQGTIEMQGAQPGCAPDGGALAPYPYVAGFFGSACQTSCATFGDAGGPGFQICSKSSECPTGQACTPIKPKGNSVGYCSPS